MDTQYILIKPVISEKSMKDAKINKYTFEVAQKARKQEIRAAIEEKFKVTVVSITTRTIKGKKNRTGKLRREIALSPIKKATVELAKDQKIALFDTGGNA